jgi:lipid-A-disaccharide synthase
MRKILLVAGEVSADQHGAELVKAIKNLDSKITFFGIGGDELEKENMEILYHIKDLAFLGLVEVLRHLPFIGKVHGELIDRVEEKKPDAAVLIDYPGFNLRLAAALKKRNIPVIYYISPQLWAWGKHRVKKIRKYVDKMLVLFPFEKRFYTNHGIEVEYVGHPMVDKHIQLLPEKVRQPVQGQIRLGLLPGSRKQEVILLLPEMLKTAKKLMEDNTINEAEIVRVSHLEERLYNQIQQNIQSNVPVVDIPLNQLLPKYDAVIAASGTATLETGFFCIPTLVVYKVNSLTYWLGKMIVKIKNIGLINIVAEKQVAPELIQHAFRPSKAAEILKRMLEPSQNTKIREELNIIRKKLGRPGASERAAKSILKHVYSR